MAITALTAPVRAAVTLPSNAAFNTTSVSDPGFVVRTAQASTTDTVANSFIRALRQINGILTDTANPNIILTNVAIPGPEAVAFTSLPTSALNEI